MIKRCPLCLRHEHFGDCVESGVDLLTRMRELELHMVNLMSIINSRKFVVKRSGLGEQLPYGSGGGGGTTYTKIGTPVTIGDSSGFPSGFFYYHEPLTDWEQSG